MRPPSIRAWLFLLLVALYLLTYNAIFHSSDGLAMFAAAENLLRRGHWDISQLEWMGLQQGTYGPDGLLYCRKGPGTSLLALPLAWLGWAVPAWGMVTTALLLNTLITAGTACIVAACVEGLGYGRRVSLAIGLIFGLGTLAWPYSKTFFSDPLAGFGLTLAALACLRYRQERHLRWAILAGIGLGLALVTRMANLVVAVPFALSLAWDAISPPNVPHPKWREAARSLRTGWRPLGAFALPMLLALATLLTYNALRFGHPLESGYLPEERFSGNWLEGVAGLLLSPGRGLLLYVPVLWIALAGWPALLQKHHREGLLWGAVALTYVALYGKWFMWHGGYAWGPRFLVPVVPLLCLGLAPWLARRHGRLAWTFFAVTLALSAAFSTLGSLVHFAWVQEGYLKEGMALFAPQTFFDPHFSPLLRQWAYLQLARLDVLWAQMLVRKHGLHTPSLLLLSCLGVVGFASWGLARSWRGRVPRWGLPLATLAVLGLTAFLLSQAHTALIAGWEPLTNEMRQWERPGDFILTNRPEETASFSEAYRGNALVVGLNEGESPLSERAAWWLDRLLQPGARLWWFPNYLPPEQSAIEGMLMARGFRVLDAHEEDRRLALYVVPPDTLRASAPAVELGRGAATLVEAAWTTQARPGEAVLVQLTWHAGSPPPGEDLTVYVHLLNRAGERVAGHDGAPLLWLRPTSTWAEGETLVDRHGFLIPQGLPTGEYTLRVGMYRPESGERLRTAQGEDGITLGVVQLQ